MGKIIKPQIVDLYYKLTNIIDYNWHKLQVKIQRFKCGYAYDDVWNMDEWFTNTIKHMLMHLKEHGSSTPIEINSRDEWCAILDEMIECLEFMDIYSVRSFLDFETLGDFEHMEPEDHKRVNEIMTNNKNRFFYLFSKYFYELWD